MPEQQIVFYSYAHEDEALRDELDKHLRLLQNRGIITTWYDRQVPSGAVRSEEINRYLSTATLILLLISSDYLASERCNLEMQRAIELQKAGSARVIPVLLRSVDWHEAPFAFLQCVPHDGKPVTEWDNRDAAFRNVAQSIRLILERQDRSSPHRDLQETSPTSSQDRRRLLKRVRTSWIEGVFENSIHHAALISLGLQERTDALDNPWHLIAQESKLPPRPLPSGTRIIDVYEQADGDLLILGEPGAGKTTLLLELTRELLNRAEQDVSYPMPVVLNLSSWAERRLPLADWLVEELRVRYQVPRPLSREWVANERLLLLLDGFDEVKEEVRPGCLTALDTYHQEHETVPLVLCSRSTEYFAQEQRLHLQYAVMIQRLEAGQIEDYLVQAGAQMKPLRDALHEDEALYDLARTPLILSILVLAYQGQAEDELQLLQGTLEAKRQQVFATYVQRMLRRRAAEKRYSAEETIHYLSWLARQMRVHNHTEFYLEYMQPDWLPTRKLLLIYRAMLLLPIVIINILIFLLFQWLLVGSIILPSLLVIGFLFVLYIVLFVVYGDTPWALHTYTVLSSRWGGPKTPDGIQFRESLTWSWQRAKRAGKLGLWIGLIFGIAIGLAVGLSAWIYTQSYVSSFDSWLSLLLILLAILVVFGLFIPICYLLIGGWSNKQLDKEMRIYPNIGVQRSKRYALRVGLIAALITGLLSSLFFEAVFGQLFYSVETGTCFALLIGAFTALGYGGDALFRHYLLRFLLWRAKLIPWDYIRFLDYAAERIFLRRVGGEYIFIHRLLLDYFAALDA